MQYRKLGRTGLDVSVICLGTMTWGEQNSEAEGHEQMDFSLDHGVNFVDTAEMYAVPPRAETYGRTEEIIGTWNKKTGRRSEVILATKVFGRAPRFGYARPHIHDGETRLDRQSITEAVEGSLRRLQTDYIDLYQIHWPDRKTNTFGQFGYVHDADDDDIPIEETLDVLADLVKAGKIRYVGLSNETAWGTMRFLHLSETKGYPRVVSNQNPYNLLFRHDEVGLAEVYCREDVGLLAYSPLAMGALSGKYLDGAMPKNSRFDLFGNYFPRYQSDTAVEEIRKYADIARKHGLDPAQMALSFVNDRPFVASNIIGATTIPQLADNIASADIELSQEILDEIAAVHMARPIGF